MTDPKFWEELKKFYNPPCTDLDLAVDLAYKCMFFGGACNAMVKLIEGMK